MKTFPLNDFARKNIAAGVLHQPQVAVFVAGIRAGLDIPEDLDPKRFRLVIDVAHIEVDEDPEPDPQADAEAAASELEAAADANGSAPVEAV